MRDSDDAGKPGEASGWEVYWTVVRRIPPGRVATYGQVARMAGRPRHARQVGWALSALKPADADDVPWQRVVNARGEISPRSSSSWDGLQREILEDEGVEFDLRGRIDLRRFGWNGDGAEE